MSSPHDPAALASLVRTLDALKEDVRVALVVDDEPLLLKSTTRVLKSLGWAAHTAASGPEALALLEQGLRPDVVLTDQRMPGMTGVQLLSAVKQRHPDVVRIAMSGHAERSEIVSAVNSGDVFRYLLKPWSIYELGAALDDARAIADSRREDDALREHLVHENVRLMASSAEQELIAERALVEAVRALAATVEAKDRYTAGHSELVSRFAVALGQRIGLGAEDCAVLRLGGVLHDVGKIGVPDAVLSKPGRLTTEEYASMKTHAAIGARIVQGLQVPHGVLEIVRSHHERWDGAGYPDGTAGDDTPFLARLVHVVDVYEAVTARRVYRDPMSHDAVLALFEKGAGTDFDPALVEPFLVLLAEGAFDRIRRDAKMDIAQEVDQFTFAGVDMAFERRVD